MSKSFSLKCSLQLAQLFAFWMIASCLLAFSQSKLIQQSKTYADAPVVLNKLKVKDKPVDFDISFETQSDWLANLTFEIESHSPKPIVGLWIAVDFPELQFPHPFRHHIFLGQPTNTHILREQTPLALHLGESIPVNFALEYGKIKKVIEEHGATDKISRINISLGQVYFSDDMMWDLDEIYRPDPQRQGKWLRVQ